MQSGFVIGYGGTGSDGLVPGEGAEAARRLTLDNFVNGSGGEIFDLLLLATGPSDLNDFGDFRGAEVNGLRMLR